MSTDIPSLSLSFVGVGFLRSPPAASLFSSLPKHTFRQFAVLNVEEGYSNGGEDAIHVDAHPRPSSTIIPFFNAAVPFSTALMRIARNFEPRETRLTLLKRAANHGRSRLAR